MKVKIYLTLTLVILFAIYAKFYAAGSSSSDTTQPQQAFSVKETNLSTPEKRATAPTPKSAVVQKADPEPRFNRIKRELDVQTKDAAREITVEETAKNFALGSHSLRALQAYSPAAASQLKQASINHNLTLLKQVYQIEASEKQAIEKLFADLFNAQAVGDIEVAKKELQGLEALIGEAASKDFSDFKTSLRMAEIQESVTRRLSALEQELNLSSEQSEQVENALLNLEDSRMSRTNADSLSAHSQRVRAFEEELQAVLSQEQFAHYLSTKPKQATTQGINPFGG